MNKRGAKKKNSRREFPQLMSDHSLGDRELMPYLAVVYFEFQPDEIR